MDLPNFTAEDLFNIGTQLGTDKRYPEAIVYLRKAHNMRPNHGNTIGNLGLNILRGGDPENAMPYLHRAVEINSEAPAAYLNRALCRMQLLEYADALVDFDKAMFYSHNAGNVDGAKWDRAYCLLSMGDWERGFPASEARLSHINAPKKIGDLKRWRGQNLNHSSILIDSEQGFGDLFMFHRYIPWLLKEYSDCHVWLRVPAEVYEIFKSAEQNYHYQDRPSDYEGKFTVIPKAHTPKGVEYFDYTQSLPIFHKTTQTNMLPDPGWIREYIKGAYYQMDVPQPAKKDTIKVGICWRGNPNHSRDHQRSIPFREFLPLFTLPNVQFYSFQNGKAASDIPEAGMNALVLDLRPLMATFAQTATVLTDMDLVITVDTALAHLAGTLDIPTWLLIHYYPDWRWGSDQSVNTTPWYPSVRLIRQGQARDWARALSNVREQLASWKRP